MIKGTSYLVKCLSNRLREALISRLTANASPVIMFDEPNFSSIVRSNNAFLMCRIRCNLQHASRIFWRTILDVV